MRIEDFIGAVLFIFCVFVVAILVAQYVAQYVAQSDERDNHLLEALRRLDREMKENEALKERIRKYEMLKNINE